MQLKISESFRAFESAMLSASGAEIIVRTLERRGVDLVAGIPGGALLPLYEALARCSRIRHILARHEQAAGFIAQGMARMTRRAAVCLATSGPGVTNILTALADAKLDSIPLVCITGQVPTHLIGTDAFQEVATVELARPITKAAFMATSPDELSELIDRAFAIAESGRTGPVLIDVPKDVQLARSNRYGAAPSVFQSTSRRNNADFDAAATLIANAQRPMLYVGGGLVKARAEHLLRQFCETNEIPLVTTLMALGALPHDHPLNLGMLGMHGSRATHRALDACDLLIAIGARFDDRATGVPAAFASNAKIIHADVDAREFGKIKEPTLSLHADAWTVLTQLMRRTCAGRRIEWIDTVKAWHRAEGLSSLPFPHPHAFVRAIGSRLSKNAIVTTDVGQHQMWVAQAFPFTRADRWLTSGGLGTMGFGLPAAIGAALAEPEAEVICFTGDGSLLMNIQEFATLAELKLPIKIVLLDNGSLGLVRQQQQLFYDRRYYAARFEHTCDFIAIARSFGLGAIDIDRDANVDAQLDAALAVKGPMLIRIGIDEHNVSPMVGPGKANIDALDC